MVTVPVGIARFAGSALGKDDVDTARFIQRKREQNERREQEEDDVDQGDDLDTRFLFAACGSAT